VVNGEVQISIRRVFARPTERPEINWDLAELAGLATSGAQATVSPDMVIPNVSVSTWLRRRTSRPTYSRPRPPGPRTRQSLTASIRSVWASGCSSHLQGGRPPPPGPDPSTLLQPWGWISSVRQGKVVYTSPNGFKVWGGSMDKWLAQILLRVHRTGSRRPLQENRIGFILESPAGTFPTLAINGPITDEELHTLIDSLMPAKEFLKSN